MPKNVMLYLGTLIVAASALLWLGAKLTQMVEWILPYTAGAGVLLLIIGLVFESRKDSSKAGKQ